RVAEGHGAEHVHKTASTLPFRAGADLTAVEVIAGLESVYNREQSARRQIGHLFGDDQVFVKLKPARASEHVQTETGAAAAIRWTTIRRTASRLTTDVEEHVQPSPLKTAVRGSLDAATCD